MKPILKTLFGTVITVGLIGGSITVYAATNTTGNATSASSTSASTHGFPSPGFHSRFASPGDMGGLLQAAAKDLNITTTTLRSDLQSGKTLATVAKAQDVSSTTLIAELEATMKASLAQAVQSGKMTSAQEQKALSGLDQRVTDFVNGEMLFRLGRRPGGPDKLGRANCQPGTFGAPGQGTTASSPANLANNAGSAS